MGMDARQKRLRADLYDHIFISPHMDDAVYSCAGRIAKLKRNGERVLVVTLFGTGNDADSQTGSRFGDYTTRRIEDESAMGFLDVDFVWLNQPELLFRKLRFSDYLDVMFPYRDVRASPTRSALLSELSELLTSRLASGGRAYFPFGMGFHPDHLMAFSVGRELDRRGTWAIEFYEDVMYSYNHTLATLRLQYEGFDVSVGPLRAASDLNHFFFRFFGRLMWLTYLPMLCYALALQTTYALLAKKPKQEGPLPTRSAEDISEVFKHKADAMRQYPSQTSVFLTMDDGIYDMLREGGGTEEKSWVFPRSS